jgi:C4-dicarboxylate transporter, DctM subunit
LAEIYGGFFTVTEAASLTVVYVVIVEDLIYKDLDVFKDLPKLMIESIVLVGSTLIILGTAMGFTNYIVVMPLIILIAQSFDVNIVHLGIVFLTNLEIGYSTSPVGINLFIATTRIKIVSSRFTFFMITVSRAYFDNLFTRNQPLLVDWVSR